MASQGGQPPAVVQKVEGEEEVVVVVAAAAATTTTVERQTITLDDFKQDALFKHLFDYKGSTDVFEQFTDEELFKKNRLIIPALIMASNLTIEETQSIFIYLTDKRQMSLKCRTPRWTQSYKDTEWALWNEFHNLSHSGFPRASILVHCTFRAHVKRQEPIPEEDEALAIACGNKVQAVIDYILTKQRPTVDLSAMGWLVFNVTSSVKIRKQLLEHFVSTHDSIDYDYDNDCFHPVIFKIHEAVTTEERKAFIEEDVAKMRQAKCDWKKQRQASIEELRKHNPEEGDDDDDDVEHLLPFELRFFHY